MAKMPQHNGTGALKRTLDIAGTATTVPAAKNVYNYILK